MNRFIIVHGLPYLYANGKTYSVRWDEKGFTVGAEVKLASVPAVTYSELSVLAQCAGHLDSITAPEATQEVAKKETAKEVDPIDGMTLNELKAYAKKKRINVNGLTKKADIIKAIKAVKAK